MLVSFPKSCCRLHICLFSNKLCLITMLIELNCFFTLLCVVMAGMWKYFSTRLPTCASRQSKRYFWRGISTKREFHYFSSLARSLCVLFCTESRKPLHVPIYLPFINLNYEFTDSSNLSSHCFKSMLGDFVFFAARCLKWTLLDEIYFEIGADKHLTWKEIGWDEWNRNLSKSQTFNDF